MALQKDAHVPKLDEGKNEGKLVNSSDPRENRDAFSEDVSPAQAPPHRTRSDPEASKPKDEKHTGREDGDLRRSTYPPSRHDAVARKPNSDSPHHQYGDRMITGDPQKKANRTSGGYDRSSEHSPLHPHYQAKSASKGGVSSPTLEKRGSSEGNHGHAPTTPGRSKLRTGGRGDETPDKSSEVPKFGEWNENNPSSADGYTQLFNKVSEERQSASAKVPIFTDDSKYLNDFKRENTFSSSSCCCFGWCKK